MSYFPAFIKLEDQPCLVVGGGAVAARKIELLARFGAHISVVAPEISQAIISLSGKINLNIQQSEFVNHDLKHYQLVVCATDDETVNTLVAKSAHTQGVLVNVVDNPELSSFIFPAIVDRSPLMIAVSSGGSAPVLARLLRAKIETAIPPVYGQLAGLAAKFRDTVKAHLSDVTIRRIFWEDVFQGPIAEQVFSGNLQAAEGELRQMLEQFKLNLPKGEVYLIGAGPGAADLLTFRALRLLQQADVILYDHLVSPEILDLGRRDAEKIYVGKQRKNHSLPQDAINLMLADLAKQGKRVARLKGGDPFIFGRGGEEIETLMEQGIAFQVVPGITAASGCASYAGIPLTHREYAQSCIFVTGHLKNNEINLNWTQLAMPGQTVVIYMGSLALNQICAALIEHGSSPELPVALIQQGTTAKQKVLVGTLATLPKLAETGVIQAPTLFIIGNVVKLRKKLDWFSLEKTKNSLKTED